MGSRTRLFTREHILSPNWCEDGKRTGTTGLATACTQSVRMVVSKGYAQLVAEILYVAE